MGIIFDLQRCSMHDGPGIRTTVFFKGCPLRCVWCHNPESWSREPQMAFYPEKCVSCGVCEAACPSGARRFSPNGYVTDRKRCASCGKCANACRHEALLIYGYSASAENIVAEACRDRAYYERTGGGLTVSGGEPFAQPEFLLETLRLAKSEGLHICVETSGFAAEPVLREAMEYVDLFLFDYKETSPAKHHAFTGADNAVILRNFDMLYEGGADILLRCPIIPGHNDTREHFTGIADMECRYPKITGIEIMPYHDMGKGKAAAIGRDWTLTEPTASDSLRQKWREELSACGCGDAVVNSF